MNKSPAFQFYPADYLADENVDLMTLEQQGAYMRLICHAWRGTTVGRLLNDPQRLSALARMSLEDWNKNSAAILRAFRVDDDGYITQKRLVQEWDKQQARVAQATMAGRKSGKLRTERALTGVQRSFKSVELKGNPSSSSSSSSSEVLPPASGGGLEHQAFIKGWTENFEAFYGFKYAFQGRDAKAVQTVLKLGIARIDLLEIAKAAWRRSQNDKFTKECKMASTIHGFVSNLNQIRTELKNEQPNGSTKVIHPVRGSSPVGGF